MDKAARWRWTLWTVLLAGTVGAIYVPGAQEAQDDTTAQAVPRHHRKPKAADASAASLAAIGDGEMGQDPQDDVLDPFSPRGWQAPPPPAPVQVQPVVAVQATEPAPPPGPPPLPFRYVGRLNDGGEQTVYLSHGEQALVAHAGDTLEGTYRVLDIAARRIEFEYIPTGEKQELAILSEN
jgi:hypothetical protein